MNTTGNEIKIRRVTTDDVEALREIRLEALRNNPIAFTADPEVAEKRSAEEWKERIRGSPIYFACDGDIVVGMTGIFRNKSAVTRHQGWIWGVYVQPAYRSRGIAASMIMQCLRWAREAGLTVTYIATAASNTPAVRCYANCGFTVYGLQPMAIFHDGRYYDELMMAQKL